jgi:hypothetical protein
MVLAAAGREATGTTRDCAGREDGLDGPPLGPPGFKSLPFVMGRPATGLGLGVGLDTELGGSPSLADTVPLL